MARNFRKIRFISFPAACCLMLLSITAGRAQRSDLFPRLSGGDKSSITATITGVVVDDNNAVVPGASVSVSGLDGNVRRGTTTGRDGDFVIFQLPPGNYNV